MRTSHRGLVAIEGREGIRLKAYRDSKGLPTIGVGHLIVPGDGFSMSSRIIQEQCDELFAQDIRKYEDAVNSLNVPLAQHQFDALVSFCLNIGTGNSKGGGFKGSTVAKRLKAGDYDGAAHAMMNWVTPKEITGRRQSEQKQFLTPYPKVSAATPAVMPTTDAPRSDELVPLDAATDTNSKPPIEQPPIVTKVEQTTVENSEGEAASKTTTMQTQSSTVVVQTVKPGLWGSIIAFGTMIYGYYKIAKEDFGDLVDRATGAIDGALILHMAIGAGLVLLGVWLWDRTRQRSHDKTVELVKTASDQNANTVVLTKEPGFFTRLKTAIRPPQEN